MAGIRYRSAAMAISARLVQAVFRRGCGCLSNMPLIARAFCIGRMFRTWIARSERLSADSVSMIGTSMIPLHDFVAELRRRMDKRLKETEDSILLGHGLDRDSVD